MPNLNHLNHLNVLFPQRSLYNSLGLNTPLSLRFQPQRSGFAKCYAETLRFAPDSPQHWLKSIFYFLQDISYLYENKRRLFSRSVMLQLKPVLYHQYLYSINFEVGVQFLILILLQNNISQL